MGLVLDIAAASLGQYSILLVLDPDPSSCIKTSEKFAANQIAAWIIDILIHHGTISLINYNHLLYAAPVL